MGRAARILLAICFAAIWYAPILLAMGFVSHAQARVERVEILQRAPFAEGSEFGATGAYELIVGRLHYAVDPDDPANARIRDLALAPRDARGLVTFTGDFILLKPVDPARGNGRLLYGVNNRGNLGMLSFFNFARRSNRPAAARHGGDGYLMVLGYSLLWSAWNWDVTEGGERLQIELPVATNDGAPITGRVAAEMTVDEPTDVRPVAWGDSRGYPAVSLDTAASLTVRDHQRDARRPIAPERWRFARRENGALVPSPTHVTLAGGFTPGRIYELVYEAGEPRIVGLGLAAIRDAISFFRFERRDDAGTANPLAPGLPTHGLIFGISQSGRVIQHMLLEALHVDEAGRMVFDGAFIHVAGGGKGSFNHRFAQTTRHPSQHEDHQYPADVFPFTTVAQDDPVTGARGSVLDLAYAAGAVPRIFYTMTSTEYWTRSASLLHTDVAGAADIGLDANARLYVAAGAQHGNYLLAGRGVYENCGNPMDHRVLARALLPALDRWLTQGTVPPDSVYPRLDDGTLGTVAAYRARFPTIPGVRVPAQNLAPPRLELGPRYIDEGIIDIVPPRLGAPFQTRVPLPDADGNDLGGIRLPEAVAPLGTYTGWNLRRAEHGAPGALGRWAGSFLPFPATEDQRRAAGDPRPSLAARYRSKEEYEARVRTAAKELVPQGFLLRADVDWLVKRSAAAYEAVSALAPGNTGCQYMRGFL